MINLDERNVDERNDLLLAIREEIPHADLGVLRLVARLVAGGERAARDFREACDIAIQREGARTPFAARLRALAGDKE